MTYICKDRGGDGCPCVLMEAGQCYTCSMIQTGRCDCPPGWQGVCPFTEYYQNGQRIGEPKQWNHLKIKDYCVYSDKLKVIVLEASAGFALKCKEMGTFLMVKAGDYSVPLSVMESSVAEGTGRVQLAFYVAGPKTMELEKVCLNNKIIVAKGPFYNGLVGSETFVYGKPTMVAAKGVAIMPFLNQKERLAKAVEKVYVDTEKLPEAFLEDYMGDIDYENVNFNDDWKRISEIAGSFRGNLLLMASPYYVDLLAQTGTENFIYPNHSNMCCGRGVCGACSHTDKEGVTVRACKCNGEIKKRPDYQTS